MAKKKLGLQSPKDLRLLVTEAEPMKVRQGQLRGVYKELLFPNTGPLKKVSPV